MVKKLPAQTWNRCLGGQQQERLLVTFCHGRRLRLNTTINVLDDAEIFIYGEKLKQATL